MFLTNVNEASEDVQVDALVNKDPDTAEGAENIAKEIISWANENNVHLNLYTNDMLYSEKDDEEIKRYAEYQELDYNVKDFSEIPMDKINKLLAIDYNDKDRVTDWVNTMSKKYPNLHIVKS